MEYGDLNLDTATIQERLDSIPDILERLDSAEKRLSSLESAPVELLFEQGTVDGTTGLPLSAQQAGANHTKRIRTAQYIENFGGTILNASGGTIMCMAHYYNQYGGESVAQESYTAGNLALDSSYNYFKIICKKTNGGEISPEEGGAIIYRKQ